MAATLRLIGNDQPAGATRLLDARFARNDAIAAKKASMAGELLSALQEDPQRRVETPAFSKGQQELSAVDVVFDMLDGAGNDAAQMREAVVRIVASASKGGHVLAQLLVSTLATKHANFHAVDAVDGADPEDDDEGFRA